MGTAYSSDVEDEAPFPSAVSHSYFSDDDDDKSAYASDLELSGESGFAFFRNRRRGRPGISSGGVGTGPGGGGGGTGGDGRGGIGGRGGLGSGGRQKTRNGDMLSNGDMEMALELELKDSWVACFKALVILVLLSGIVVLSAFTYRVTKDDQQEDFQVHFDDFAEQIMETSRRNTKHNLEEYGRLSTTLTNWAIGTNETWPFVTYPQFESEVAHMVRKDVEEEEEEIDEDVVVAAAAAADNDEHHASIVALLPFVTGAQRRQWETYTLNHHQGWVQQGLDYRGNNETAQPAIPYIYHLTESSSTSNSMEYEYAEPFLEDTNNQMYAPVWQYAPVRAQPFAVNLDVLDYPFVRRVVHVWDEEQVETTNTKQLFISMIIDPSSQAKLAELQAKFQMDSKQENESGGTSLAPPVDFSSRNTWPQTFLAAPVFDSHHAQTKKIVAMVMGFQPVHLNLINLVPEGITGIVLVFRNPCHPSFTYEIDGRNVNFLGHGDLHDPKYGQYERTTSDTGFPITSSDKNGGDDECPYTLHVYPTATFEETYNYREPTRYTAIIAGAFFVTAVVFLLYDCMVERRQSLVLATARRSNQIINSLFPETVRDRLLVNHNGGNAAGQRTQNQEQAQPTVQVVTELVTGMPKAVLHAARNPSVLIPDLRTIPNRLSAAAPFITGGTSGGPNQHRRGSKEWKTNNGDDNMNLSAHRSGKPIADFFPFVSVMFSDIVGFTAWSSVREPFQVFTLLEAVYNAFDRIAKKLRIFKVETIGDCYVAAAGLPEPRDDHAVVMARFARACLAKMNRIVHKLERELGPGTGDLSMRVGVHSGPVTAGVLRGEKSRFQLFGDTVNTAARMESTGAKSKIQVSSQTANLLMGAGKTHWVMPRETKIMAKGKGELQTYWLDVHSRRRVGPKTNSVGTAPSEANGSDAAILVDFVEEVEKELEDRARSPTLAGDDSQVEANDWDSLGEMPDWDIGPGSVISDDIDIADDRIRRLVGWSVDVLQNLLKRIVAMRDDEDELSELDGSDFEEDYDGDDEEGGDTKKARSKKALKDEPIDPLVETPQQDTSSTSGPTRTMVLEEVKEIITLPSQASKYKRDPSTVRLSSAVVSQLERYVSSIAGFYPDNPFHCFEHASHVIQSVTKLLARVVTPDRTTYGSDMSFRRSNAELLPATQLHEYTYGITSDPLTQFACAFSALIHDVDHRGIPNVQLVKEHSDLAVLYKNKSVAEQNSVDLAWNMLMQPEYSDLRSCIYKTESQLNRFRQLVVNSVMATDIADKELGALRKARWAKAFDTNTVVENPGDGDDECSLEKLALDDVNRKATIVIEHLIQASDVAHTMQHWYVYKKWNERLFHEMYRAYLEGRAGSDPSKNWYAGELGFFDFYVIPLAQKLKECGVFGVASEEYLTYAMANRQEWELKGKETVQGYLAVYGDGTENGSVISV